MQLKNVGFKPKMMRTDEEILYINGKEAGFILPMQGTSLPEHRWHCGISLEVRDQIVTTLVQGFGETREDAVKNTLLKATQYAEDLALAIALIKIDVGV